MLLTALATFLVLAGAEVLLFAGAQSWFAGSLGPAGNAAYLLVLFGLPVVNLVGAWFIARRICVWLWPDLVEDEARPTKRRLARQEQA